MMPTSQLLIISLAVLDPFVAAIHAMRVCLSRL